ncbi:MAG: phosphoribosylglycinamide formyltransferase [Azospirillum sp.]|nr:phosphoribosylglycinamide formyltransferase [Azospirillum sp.]
MARLKLAVLISGRGTNLQALIEACADSAYPAEIALVVSNQGDAPGLQRAIAAGVPAQVINHRAFAAKQAFEAMLDAALRNARVELVCLAGFMRILSPWFCERWRDRLINIHPSLLPAFKGLETHAKVIEAGVRITGCTVHFVRAAMDDGPILVQAAVAVASDDDPVRLAARVLEAEHRCYPLAVRLIASGHVRIDNERVVISGAVDAPATVLINPTA